ncbi:MAG: VOC family protein [Ilumatobacter sp.]|uniref:VOC family protein n=1 Tax=Ilumatobacter sp. TaxID=1967498 RepID=UPI00260A6A9F|nr:VOC family protein [Ilumatobacter sp.]MDJ0768960.1 VOC family protein [Ilumatobacter sp.]
MAHLHPRGVNHLALSTTDMKRQLAFWCDALGLPLKALYWMHGVEGAYHGFVELAPDSYVAFVQHPNNDKDVEFGVSHADGPGGEVRGGTMQHVAFHVDAFDELLEMRDRLRSKGVQVLGPIDHGFVQSIYFDGPEGLNLEITCGAGIDERAWIDPEVTGLCGITDEELEVLKHPGPFERPAARVPQPTEPHPESVRAQRDPRRHAAVMGMPDDVVWERFSETTPPVEPDG